MPQPGPDDATLIQLPLAGGLDETMDDAFVPPDKSRICENVVFPDPTTAAKRPGLVQLGTVTGGRKLVAHDSEVLVLDPQTAWAYAPSQAGFVNRGAAPQCLVSRRLLASGNVKLPASEVAANFDYPIAPTASIAEDPATHLQVAAWCDGNAIQASIYDPVAGAYVMGAVSLYTRSNPTTNGPQFNPRVVIVNSYAYVIYNGSSGTTLQYRSINLANTAAGWSSVASTPTSVYPGISWDACFCTLTVSGVNTSCVAVASVASGNTSVFLYYFTASAGVLSAGATTQVTSGIFWLGLTFSQCSVAASLPTDASNAVAVIIGTPAPSAFFTLVNGTTSGPAVGAKVLLATVAATTIRTLSIVRTGASVSGVPTWIISVSGDGLVSPSYNTRPVARSTTVVQYGVVSSDTTTVPGNWYGPFLGYQGLSKPTMLPVNGTLCGYMLWLWQDGQRYDSTQPAQLVEGAVAPSPSTTGSIAQTVVAVQLLTSGAPNASTLVAPVPVATMANRFAGYPTPANFDVATFTQTLPSGLNALGFTAIGCESDVAGDTSLTALSMDFNNPNIGQSVRLGDWTWISGGLPLIYDGNVITEVGFINQPPAPAISLPSSGSPVLPTLTTLTYQVCYAQQDLGGNIHRSPPSVPSIVDASAGYSDAKLGIVPYSITLRQAAGGATSTVNGNPVQIEIYRNSSAAPEVMQLLTVIPNDPTQQFITFDDAAADNSNVTFPVIYTDGGGVPSCGPPNLSGLAVHSDRIFGISEDGQTTYFTTQYQRGECPRMTDAFTMTWPHGPITALWSLEQRLHASTPYDLYYTFGNGPNDNGAGSDFDTPSLWQAGLGVTDSRGVALFQGGAILSTAKGFYLEDRGSNFTWLSECKRTLASNPVVTGISIIDSFGTIRINAQEEDGINQDGVTFHYDYRHQKWATHVPNQDGSSNGLLSSCVAGGVYHALWAVRNFSNTANLGVLLQESASTRLDGAVGGANWVTATIATGWAAPNGPQGYARLRLVMVLAEQESPCQIAVQVARDYSSSFDSPLSTWTDTALSGLSVLQLQATADVRKAEVFSFQVTDAAPATLGVGTGEGVVWKNILARIRGKRGEYKQLNQTERR